MDILIKGIEMPRGNNVLVVDSAGTITKVNRWTGKAEATDPFHVKAIELPSHGRLVQDTDVKEILRSGVSLDCDADRDYVCELIDELPTIVEASYGSDN